MLVIYATVFRTDNILLFLMVLNNMIKPNKNKIYSRLRSFRETLGKKDGSFNHTDTSILSALGMLITVSSFLALYFSWSFAKGFYSAFGIPIFNIPFSRGFELSPEVGIIGVLLSLVVVLAGLWLSTIFDESCVKYTKYPLLILFLVGCVLSWYFNIKVVLMLFYLYCIGLLLIGIFAWNQIGIKKLVAILIIFLFTISQGGIFLFEGGRVTARTIVYESEKLISVHFIRELVNLPPVIVYSNKKLAFRTKPTLVGGKYKYVGENIFLIYLVYADSEAYYFLEGKNPIESQGASFALLSAIRKSDVAEIHYLGLLKPPSNYFEAVMQRNDKLRKIINFLFTNSAE